MAGLARRDIRLGTARRAALPGGAGSRSKDLRAIYQKPGPLDGHKLRLGTTMSKFNGLHRFAAAHLARVLFFPLLRYFEIAAPTRSQTSFVTKKMASCPVDRVPGSTLTSSSRFATSPGIANAGATLASYRAQAQPSHSRGCLFGHCSLGNGQSHRTMKTAVQRPWFVAPFRPRHLPICT